MDRFHRYFPSNTMPGIRHIVLACPLNTVSQVRFSHGEMFKPCLGSGIQYWHVLSDHTFRISYTETNWSMPCIRDLLHSDTQVRWSLMDPLQGYRLGYGKNIGHGITLSSSCGGLRGLRPLFGAFGPTEGQLEKKLASYISKWLSNSQLKLMKKWSKIGKSAHEN